MPVSNGAFEETRSRALSTILSDESAPYARTPVIADNFRKSLRSILVTDLSFFPSNETCKKCGLVRS